MGLSSNIIWHQSSFEAIQEIIKSQTFICSYSIETIKWRKSEIDVAFPMISFCDIPISDMQEYLTHNQTGILNGKYGECTIGMTQDWAFNAGMCHVWYLDPRCNYLREVLPTKKKLLQSLKSRKYHNRWHLLSRIKPITGNLKSKGFIDYRFYDEKEVRYVPSPKSLEAKSVEKILTKNEYDEYKLQRATNLGDNTGNSLIPELKLSFKMSDVRYILCYTKSQMERINELLNGQCRDIVIMEYSRIVEEIIGTSHFKKQS